MSGAGIKQLVFFGRESLVLRQQLRILPPANRQSGVATGSIISHFTKTTTKSHLLQEKFRPLTKQVQSCASSLADVLLGIAQLLIQRLEVELAWAQGGAAAAQAGDQSLMAFRKPHMHAAWCHLIHAASISFAA
jgi:hypothetical protein